MRTMDLTGRALRGIDRYRRSSWHTRTAGCCRFEQSCSHYAETSLRRHALPVALVLIVWRVLRCNPLVATRRDRRRALSVLALAGITTALVSWTAAAVAAPATRFGAGTIAGGCSAQVGGRSISDLTSDHALQVYKGQAIVVNGVAPDGATGHTGVTSAKIYLIENLLSTDVNEPSTGTTFRQTVNVDTYLNYGSGVYRVDARSLAPGGWDCSATFYVELNGSKWAAEAAVAAGAVGAVAVLASTTGGQPEPSDEYEDTSAKTDAANEEWDRGVAAQAKKDSSANAVANSGWGCLVAVLAAMVVLSHGSLAAIPPPSARPGRVWVKGHTVWGFFGGLLMGLGLLVAGWQYGLFPLTQTNVFLPLAAAVLSALRARRGRAWKVS